jgi:hypothetical protein
MNELLKNQSLNKILELFHINGIRLKMYILFIQWVVSEKNEVDGLVCLNRMFDGHYTSASFDSHYVSKCHL